MTRNKPQTKFIEKWSEQIQSRGFTEIPNLLIEYQGKLGISATEMCVINALLKFQWDANNPFPAVSTLAEYVGKSPLTVIRKVTALQKKGYVERIERAGRTNEYVVTQKLAVKLVNVWREEQLEKQKRQGGMSKNDEAPPSKMTHKEYAPKEYPRIIAEDKATKSDNSPEGKGLLAARQMAEKIKLRAAKKQDGR